MLCVRECLRQEIVKSNLPLWQVSEAGHAGQTAEDPGELSVLRHLQGLREVGGGDTHTETDISCTELHNSRSHSTFIHLLSNNKILYILYLILCFRSNNLVSLGHMFWSSYVLVNSESFMFHSQCNSSMFPNLQPAIFGIQLPELNVKLTSICKSVGSSTNT